MNYTASFARLNYHDIRSYLYSNLVKKSVMQQEYNQRHAIAVCTGVKIQ
jgi:hypothetical protein